MEYLSIIIDRVQNTNVFNIIQGRTPGRETHLQTITDDDLIDEFLFEVGRLSRIANTVAHGDEDRAPVGLLDEFRRIGETFYLQIFPEQIQERLRATPSAFLFLHVDQKLRNIPWELLHDGSGFLADRFFIGKNIAGYWRDPFRSERDQLRALIIADPTEDLDWAYQEGEALYESLTAEVSADRLDVQFVSGRRISKLSLLNAIKDRDIIHYAGHLHYAQDQQESGWLLADGKILRAREIEKAGIVPHLVFANSCLSFADSPDEEPVEAEGARLNELAGAFLRAGIANYIGTNWEVKDSEHTADFALNFYRAIFEERSVGEALFQARQFARQTYPADDITWANYSLHGNPMTRIFRSGNRRSFDASRNALYSNRVIETYPRPIALAYKALMEAEEDPATHLQCLGNVLSRTLLVVGALVFGNYVHLRMKERLPDLNAIESLEAWNASVYECLSAVYNLHRDLAVGRLLEYLYLHRDNIDTMLQWMRVHNSGSMAEDDRETYAVTFQYHLDNLLSDLSVIGRHRFLYLPERGDDCAVLNGAEAAAMRLLPEGLEDAAMKQTIQENRGRVCFHNPSRRILFSLEPWLGYDPERAQVVFPDFAETAPSTIE